MQTAAELAYAAVVLRAVVRHVGIVRPRVDVAAWRSTLRQSAPLLANALARTALFSFDVLLIAVLLGQAAVGLYGAAYRPVLFLSTTIGLFASACLSAYSAADPATARGPLALRTVRVAGVVTVAAAGAAGLLAEPLLATVFGAAFAGGAAALAILAWTLPLLALAVPYGTVLVAAGRQPRPHAREPPGCRLERRGELVVVPVAGIEGAAVVTVVSLGLMLVLGDRASVAAGLAPSAREVLRGRAA